MPETAVALGSLWLPILLSAVAAFVASFFFWAILGWHNKDWARLPDEDAARAGLQGNPPAPGQYSIPHCANQKDMAGDSHQAKVKEGPVALLVVLPNAMPNMPKMLGSWFVYLVGVCIVVAYLTSRSVAAGAGFMPVFQIAGATAVLGFPRRSFRGRSGSGNLGRARSKKWLMESSTVSLRARSSVGFGLGPRSSAKVTIDGSVQRVARTSRGSTENGGARRRERWCG